MSSRNIDVALVGYSVIMPQLCGISKIKYKVSCQINSDDSNSQCSDQMNVDAAAKINFLPDK